MALDLEGRVLGVRIGFVVKRFAIFLTCLSESENCNDMSLGFSVVSWQS